LIIKKKYGNSFFGFRSNLYSSDSGLNLGLVIAAASLIRRGCFSLHAKSEIEIRIKCIVFIFMDILFLGITDLNNNLPKIH